MPTPTRATFHDQSVEITSGLSVHRTGGHSGGLQVVRVWTERGWVVVASTPRIST